MGSSRRGSTGKRPCSICRKWFQPSARARGRQRACSTPECQRERHRRACGAWRQANPDYDRETRLRARLQPETSAAGHPLEVDPLRRVRWDAARDAVGLEASVIVEEFGQVMAKWVRDAVIAQPLVLKEDFPKVIPEPARDAMGARAPPS